MAILKISTNRNYQNFTSAMCMKNTVYSPGKHRKIVFTLKESDRLGHMTWNNILSKHKLRSIHREKLSFVKKEAPANQFTI